MRPVPGTTLRVAARSLSTYQRRASPVRRRPAAPAYAPVVVIAHTPSNSPPGTSRDPSAESSPDMASASPPARPASAALVGSSTKSIPAKKKWPTAAEAWSVAVESGSIMAFGEPGERAWFNLLLVCFPLAFVSSASGWPPGATFALSLVAMMPLAERLGFCTECIADHTNDTLGGLMNATMGNAPELIISLFALKDGLLRVVQVSLVGSVLSNLLLVLGSGFLLGGVRYSEQTFNAAASHLNAGMLLLAMMCLLFPAVLSASGTEVVSGASVLLLSRLVSIVMLLVYAAFLVFQLRTHAHLFESAAEGDEREAAEGAAAAAADADAAAAGARAQAGSPGGPSGTSGGDAEDALMRALRQCEAADGPVGGGVAAHGARGGGSPRGARHAPPHASLALSPHATGEAAYVSLPARRGGPPTGAAGTSSRSLTAALRALPVAGAGGGGGVAGSASSSAGATPAGGSRSPALGGPAGGADAPAMPGIELTAVGAGGRGVSAQHGGSPTGGIAARRVARLDMRSHSRRALDIEAGGGDATQAAGASGGGDSRSGSRSGSLAGSRAGSTRNLDIILEGAGGGADGGDGGAGAGSGTGLTLNGGGGGGGGAPTSPGDVGVAVDAAAASARGHGGSGGAEGSASSEEGEPPLGLWTAIIWLAAVAAGVAALSETLVGSISGAAASSGLSEMFVSAILLPIAGNAAEHASAVIFAYKNRLDISLGVAIGSSTQIALFVAPFCVLVGWMMGQPLSLDFQLFETATLILTVLMVNFIIIDGRANWMIGLLLIAGYAIVALSFAMHSGSGV